MISTYGRTVREYDVFKKDIYSKKGGKMMTERKMMTPGQVRRELNRTIRRPTAPRAWCLIHGKIKPERTYSFQEPTLRTPKGEIVTLGEVVDELAE